MNDVEVGRCVNEIHRLVVGFQYADEHGEGELYLELISLLLHVVVI